MTPDLSNILTELELERKNISQLKIWSFSLIALGILVAILSFVLPALSWFPLLIGSIPFVFGIIKLNQSNTAFNQYRHQFKVKAIAGAMRSIDPSLEIDYQYGLSERNFVCSKLFNTKPDRYSSEDQIKGKAGKTQFIFSEVHAEYKTETKTKNGTEVRWHDIFRGIIFCADFNKNFHGTTIVTPRGLGSSIKDWFDKNIPISSSGDTTVRLENPNFERCFSTYSSDQVEARYILTPALMERICELEGKCKYTISMSFVDSYMYIAFPLDKNYFEPPIFSSLLEDTNWQQDLEVIKFMYNIVESLDLNTRIWGKA